MAIYVLMIAEEPVTSKESHPQPRQRPLLDAMAKAHQSDPSVSIFLPTNPTGATRTFSTRHTGPDTRQARQLRTLAS